MSACNETACIFSVLDQQIVTEAEVGGLVGCTFGYSDSIIRDACTPVGNDMHE